MNIDILQLKKYLPSDQSRVIKQARFMHFSFRKGIWKINTSNWISTKNNKSKLHKPQNVFNQQPTIKHVIPKDQLNEEVKMEIDKIKDTIIRK